VEYKLKIGEDTLDLDIETDGDDRFSAIIGEKKYPVAHQRISDHQLLLSVDGRNVIAFVADTPDGKAVMIDGHGWMVEDADARSQRGRRKGGPKAEPTDVTPPMPAVVTQILVAEGDTVTKGQGVIVVSAMKMETTLPSPFDGQVTKINVAEGDKVAPKQVLVDIEAVEEA
jgi:biotin carboxyl carrier protein